MKTRQAIQEFMASRAGLRAGSLRTYRQHLRAFQEQFKELPAEPLPLQMWLAGPGVLSQASLQTRYSVLRALYRQLSIYHQDMRNPMAQVRMQRVRPRAMRVFSEDELYRIFNLSLSQRDRTLLTLLLDTGVRCGECAGLPWERVYAGFIVVDGKTGEREVPISPATYRLLIGLGKETFSEAVFSGRRGPLTTSGIYRLVAGRCAEAGISGRRASPHTFRSTFATHYASQDACDPQVLQRILGHRDFGTTLRYINASRRRILENHRACSPLRGLEALAQGRLAMEGREAVDEAERILAP